MRQPFPSLLLCLSLLLCGIPALSAGAEPECNYVPVATLPIHYAGRGLQPNVAGSIEGKPAPMLLDTGANTTYLITTAWSRGCRRKPTTATPTRSPNWRGCGASVQWHKAHDDPARAMDATEGACAKPEDD